METMILGAESLASTPPMILPWLGQDDGGDEQSFPLTSVELPFSEIRVEDEPELGCFPKCEPTS